MTVRNRKPPVGARSAAVSGPQDRVVLKVGAWAAALATVAIVLFDAGIALGAAGVMTGTTLPVAASLAIAPSWLAVLSALHRDIPEDRRIWSQMALSFGAVYAAIVAINYALQLTVVPANPQAFDVWTMDFRSDSAFWALEIAGYAFMALSALVLVPTLRRDRPERVAAWLFAINAVGSVFGAGSYLATGNPAHWLGLTSLVVWGVVFPAATALLGWNWYARLAR